jgi:hypothetical protein
MSRDDGRSRVLATPLRGYQFDSYSDSYRRQNTLSVQAFIELTAEYLVFHCLSKR